MSSERSPIPMTEALQAALEENDRLHREIHLLRAQLRRHPSGELQIRQTRRQLASLAHATPCTTPPPVG